jgi:hypothetical protein
MFIEIEMKYLSEFPKNVYAKDAKLGDEPITSSPYAYIQLGAHPEKQTIIAYIEGDEELFEKEMVDKFKQITVIPDGYQQTCCNEFLHGRTLTKATIVAWQYPLDVEMGIHRNMIGLTEETDEFSAYNAFVELVPSDSA